VVVGVLLLEIKGGREDRLFNELCSVLH
jgi:hypothetical protein